MTRRALPIFLLLLKTVLASNLYCLWSIETMQRVESCPTRGLDWLIAAERKNCSMYASVQNCTKDIEQFQYHCVINEYRNATVEVCAPVRFIIDGFCTEFNTEGGRIQPHYDRKCSDFRNPCPDRYKSTDAFKYPMCYEFAKPASNMTTTEGIYSTPLTTNSSISNSNKSNDSSVPSWIIPVAIILVLIILLLIVVLIILLRRKLRNQPAGRKVLEEGTELLHATRDDRQKQTYLFSDTMDTKENTKDESQSIISRESATDELVVIRGEILLDMKRGKTDITAEENIRESKRKIDPYKPLNAYFVQTQLVNATEGALRKNGVAILTGPPGCGKSNTAYHLMLGEFYKDWAIRIIRTYDEFTFLESGKNTFVYIDNFLDGFLCFEKLDKWLEIFTTIFYKHIRKTENGLTTISGSGNVHLLITARENVFDRICQYMKQGRSPVFNSKCIVDARTVRLSDEEKDEIFDSQIKYAKEIIHIDPPAEDEEFRREIKKAEGPVGFPLCAHLYACKEEYRYTGPHFFSYPLKYFRTEIRHEIDADSTKKTMTLLLLLFLFESKNEDSNQSEHLDLRSEKQCKKILLQLLNTQKKLSMFDPLDYANLINVAENLTAGILIGSKESGFYCFKHQSIREAVGHFFCTEYFEPAMKVFPFEVLQSQNFSACSIDQYIALTTRLILEIKTGNVSMVFGCNAFKVDAYSKHFTGQLKTYSNKNLRRFLLISDEKSSIPLPAIFWISKYKLKKLMELFSLLITERGIDVEIHFYLGLFGELCTIDENLQTTADRNMSGDVAKTKRAVLGYTDSEKNTILNIVIRSDRSDTEAMDVIKMLLKEDKSIVKHANQHNETPVMLAVTCNRERKKVLKELMHTDKNLKLSTKDERGWTAFHHCVNSDLKDKECVEYITILLDSNLHRDLASCSKLGETALNLAAKHATHSRILSILSLIEDKDISNIDNDGRTPIHSAVAVLKKVGHDPYIELEIATRISIFIIYGCDVGIKDDDDCLAADICNKTHYNYIQRLLNKKSNDQKNMSKILQCTLQQIEEKSGEKRLNVPNPMGRISTEMLDTIGRAAECLAETDFAPL